jgi:CubicO group peptidase (beta-lactamase class C family)
MLWLKGAHGFTPSGYSGCATSWHYIILKSIASVVIRKNHFCMTNIIEKTTNQVVGITFICLLTSCYACYENRSQKNINPGNYRRTEGVTVNRSGMDTGKPDAIQLQMQQFVNDKKIAGAVTLVAHNGQVFSFKAVGLQNIERKIPMQKNTIFRIASMTKPFSAAAIMMLSEEGKLQLDDPVEKYLPEFRDLWVAARLTGDTATLVRPSRHITIRDILTHTSGLSALPEVVPVNSIAEYILVISQRPLLFEPGSQWRYGGSGITAAARIVEVLTGQPYEVFLSKRIFKPLGMKNTSFTLPKGSTQKIAVLYHPSADSSGLEAIEAPARLYRFPHPEGGLFSTAQDMYKWMQAILNKGIYNGIRILNEESVVEMIKIQTGEFNTGFTEGMSYGLGFGIVHNPTGVTAMLSEGTFGHGGAFGTQYWADPVKNAVYILMIQRQGFGNGDDSDVRAAFQKVAAEAL